MMINPNQTKPERYYNIEGGASFIVSDLYHGHGVYKIALERQRQIESEGWTAHHDDRHTDQEMAMAGACYALSHEARRNIEEAYNADIRSIIWPWTHEWYKPSIPGNRTSRIRELTKAGALIAAEIDRLCRLP